MLLDSQQGDNQYGSNSKGISVGAAQPTTAGATVPPPVTTQPNAETAPPETQNTNENQGPGQGG